MKQYKIAVVGLGLIGGSICKAITQYTDHECYAIDTNQAVISLAVKEKVIIKEISTLDLQDMDFIFIALYPKATIEFINKNEKNFGKHTIVIDCCGVKDKILKNINTKGINFIGGHPMAGTEHTGFEFSKANMFKGAYFIFTPENIDDTYINKAKTLVYSLGFSNVTITTAKHHDAVIAYTSQLAHIVSSAYINSNTLSQRVGFSAGSFKDLTRVAKMNSSMWADLFLSNKKPLISEINTMVNNLNELKNAIETEDINYLTEILERSNQLKIMDNSRR